MTWDASTRRVSPTAPLDADLQVKFGNPVQLNQPLPDAVTNDEAFGSDGNTAQSLASATSGQAVDLTVSSAISQGTPQCADDVKLALDAAATAKGKHQQTLQVSQTVRRQAASVPKTVSFDAAITSLKSSLTRLDKGKKELSQQITALQKVAKTLQPGDTRGAKITALIGELNGTLTALKAERTKANAALTRVREQQGAAQSQQRTALLSNLTAQVTAAETPQEQAALVDAAAKQVKRLGGSPETLKLLTDMSKGLRGAGVYRGQINGDSQQVLKALGTTTPVAAERSAVTDLAVAVGSKVRHHAPRSLGPIPQITYYKASSDAQGVSRNAAITGNYGKLEDVAQTYIGEPKLNTWFYMGQNASGEVRKALDNKTGCVMESPWTSIKTLVAHPITTVDGSFDDALKAGNREIYNTIAPTAEIFFKAEAAGEDGIQAILASRHFQVNLKRNPDHPTYANTDKLIEGFRYLQRAQGCGDEQQRAGLISKFNKCIADYEQRQVLQPVLDADPDVRSYLKSVGKAMAWTRPDGVREPLLPNGGDWGNPDVRLKAIGHVSDVSVAYQIAQRKKQQFAKQVQEQGLMGGAQSRFVPAIPQTRNLPESTGTQSTIRYATALAVMDAQSDALKLVQSGERLVSQ